MTRNEIEIIPEYFTTYTKLVPERMGVMEALDSFGPSYLEKHKQKFAKLGDMVYAHGKWTVKQTLVHLIDGERVFAYRALRFARGDKSPLAGFDQDDYALTADVSNRSLEDILTEFKAVRSATIELFKTFKNSELKNYGKASGNDVSALALGFMIAGHVIHHQKIFESKYFPLIR